MSSNPERNTPGRASIDGVFGTTRTRRATGQPIRPVVSPVLTGTTSWQPQASNWQDAAAAPGLARTTEYVPKASMRPSGSRPAKRKRLTWKRSVAVLVVLLLMVGSWEGFSVLHAVNKVFHGSIVADAQALFTTTPLAGEDHGRVNILLAGDSSDDLGHGGADLTDSIMVLSIDTKHHSAFMLSVPRDLWVNIPGWSHQKINAANDVTSFSQPGYPKGGMGQLQQIVQTNLGIPINYYALINYTAFKDAVNAVGGITVNIQSPDPRGLFDPNISKADGGPLKMPNGEQTLSGQQALNLARARGDPCGCGRVEYGFPQSDYNRTQHQRMMLLALEQKALSAGVLSNPYRVTQLFGSMGTNVLTDMNLQNIMRLTQVTKGIDMTAVQSLSYSNGGPNALLTSYTTPDGEEALAPRAGIDEFGQLQQYYQQLVSDNPIAKEGPSVVVLNGTNTTGLARKEAAVLRQQGFNVLSTADTNLNYGGSMIVDKTGSQKPSSKQTLQKIFGHATVASPTVSGEAAEANGYTTDFVVILGADAATHP